jgi:hypothetical protein
MGAAFSISPPLSNNDVIRIGKIDLLFHDH